MSQAKSRRRFLKHSAAAVTGMAATSCTPPREADSPARARTLERSTLDALGAVVLSAKALGRDGIGRVLDDFVTWLEGFEPVAELDHPYLWTDEIAYGPSDPAPLWQSQLDALEIEASKRFGRAYPELDPRERRTVLERQLPKNAGAELPYAGAAPHVAIGILAYFHQTPEANDLGYRAAIQKQTCRGLDASPEEPTPLGD